MESIRGVSSEPGAGHQSPMVADHAAQAPRLAATVAIPTRASRTGWPTRQITRRTGMWLPCSTSRSSS